MSTNNNTEQERIQRKKEQNRRWYEKNKEKVIEKAKQWHKDNPEKVREIHKKYAAAHVEEERIRSRNKRRTRREQERIYRRAYRQKHLIEHRAYEAKRRATKRNAGGSYTKQDIDNLYKLQKGKCWWDTRHSLENGYHIDHRIPLAKGGTNDISNIVLTCPRCNLSKGDKLPDEFTGRLL